VIFEVGSRSGDTTRNGPAPAAEQGGVIGERSSPLQRPGNGRTQNASTGKPWGGSLGGPEPGADPGFLHLLRAIQPLDRGAQPAWAANHGLPRRDVAFRRSGDQFPLATEAQAGRQSWISTPVALGGGGQGRRPAAATDSSAAGLSRNDPSARRPVRLPLSGSGLSLLINRLAHNPNPAEWHGRPGPRLQAVQASTGPAGERSSNLVALPRHATSTAGGAISNAQSVSLGAGKPGPTIQSSTRNACTPLPPDAWFFFS